MEKRARRAVSRRATRTRTTAATMGQPWSPSSSSVAAAASSSAASLLVPAFPPGPSVRLSSCSLQVCSTAAIYSPPPLLVLRTSTTHRRTELSTAPQLAPARMRRLGCVSRKVPVCECARSSGDERGAIRSAVGEALVCARERETSKREDPSGDGGGSGEK